MSDGRSQTGGIGWVLLFGVLSFVLAALCDIPYAVVTDENGASRTVFERFFSSSPNEMGDTLAGFFGSLAFFAATVAILLQSRELSQHHREFKSMNSNMESQRFEAAFFQMLHTHNDIVASIEVAHHKTGEVKRGRRAFKNVYTEFARSYRKKRKKKDLVKGGFVHTEKVALEISYKALWTKHQTELAHYYRFLFNFFKMIAESPFATERHGKLLRSQISDQELLLLFYNSNTKRGKSFLTYLEKFEVFDNLPVERLLSSCHKDFFPAKCFGDNKMENSSDLRHSINRGRK